MSKLLFGLIACISFWSCSTSPNNNGGSTTTVIPLAPSNLTGVLVSSSQVDLTWIDHSTNETGFKIERRLDGGNFAVVGTVNADVLNFSDVGLTANTNYTYRVLSYNAIGSSLTYSNEWSINTGGSIPTGNTVTICNQVWMTKNLDVSTYRNGDAIPQVTDPTQWNNIATGAWCYYNNDSATYAATYGKLYNWYAVNDPRGLAPFGWHVPLYAEWKKLVKCIDPVADTNTTTTLLSATAGGAMKEAGLTHWLNPNTGATNSSGFAGLPGASRSQDGTFGVFSVFGSQGNWWSYTNGPTGSLCLTLDYTNTSVNIYDCFVADGFSVRCIKD